MIEKASCEQNIESLFSALESGPDGLGQHQAERRLSSYGANTLVEDVRQGFSAFLLKQFNDFMIIVLLVAAAIAGLLGEVVDTIAILVIVLFNAIIGAIQSYRADRAIASLKKLSAPQVLVKRDGKLTPMIAANLVPGDVVQLEAGNLVAADIRLFADEGLQADESALTGESVPVVKSSAALTRNPTGLGEQSNMLFSGSLITQGQGQGIVIHTGMNTELGKIAGMLQNAEDDSTPLQKRLSRFGRYLAAAVLVICVIVFIAGLFQGHPVMLMLLTSVSLAVAAIPEALPAVIAISLALGARNLLKLNALVRNLPAVETLGSVTFICTDKTGTLTQNRMSAEAFVCDGKLLDNTIVPHEDMLQVMALSNDVTSTGQKPIGEPTELALYEYALAQGKNKAELDQVMPRIASIPFDSERKRMSTLHQQQGEVMLLCKGAAESVLKQCTGAFEAGVRVPLNPQHYLHLAETLAGQGYRVIALARRFFALQPPDLNQQSLEQELEFLGLVGLIDPLRPEVFDAMDDCQQAGIQTIMITGDHPATAASIATKMGWQLSPDQVVDGDMIARCDQTALTDIVSKARVYARISPQQKLDIVSALQQRDEFVAMTGDGVNDAPALKKADIGVAMGLKGTDVARQAADMVLLDDNFATIVGAVKTGRRIFDNIRKFIKDTLSSNSGEIWTLFLAPVFGLPIPLLPIHILWINLVTDGLPGLAFSTEPAEQNVMKRPPRPPGENIFAHGMWQHIIWVGLFVAGLSLGAMYWAISSGREYWQTIVFTVLTLSQLFHSLVVRGEVTSLFKLGLLSNKAMLLALLMAFSAQLAIIYVPFFNGLFNTMPLPLSDLLICIGIASLVFWVVELEKLVMRNKHGN